jgi:hypothetical protein
MIDSETHPPLLAAQLESAHLESAHLESVHLLDRRSRES